MAISASALRNNIYKLLDQVLATGQPLEIERKGKRLRIVPEPEPGKMARLVRHACLSSDPESIVHMDWSSEWQDDLS